MPEGGEWKLVWSDEFDAPRLDHTKWNRLRRLETARRLLGEGGRLHDGEGTLLLRTKKDGDRYTCGAVNTQGKFEHAFGYYVAAASSRSSRATGPPSG